MKLTAFSQLDKPLLIAPAKDLVQRLAKLGTEPAQYAAPMDEPTYKVSTHFSDVPPEGYLSIVVGVPANGEMGICHVDHPLLTSPFHDCPHYATDSLHRKQHETRDELTELRQFNLSRRQERAPSQGAAPSTFRRDQASHPIQFGRPRDDHFYPLPICLLQPEFGTFQDDLCSVPLDPSLSPLGWEWVTKLSLLFEKESDREKALHKLLASLLGRDVVIEKMHIGKYQTDGGVRIPQTDLPNLLVVPVNIEVKNETTEGGADGVFENILYFREGVRVLLTEKYKGDWKKTRFPSILILHNGMFLAQLLTLLP